jgi:hypothetical protein
MFYLFLSQLNEKVVLFFINNINNRVILFFSRSFQT